MYNVLDMAVPKQRRTKSKRNSRRSHDSLKLPQLIQVGKKLIPHRLQKAQKLGLLK